jgi:hypothetical protein
MGRLRSKMNHRPTKVNGVELGEPVITREDGTPFQEGDNIADLVFAWDDSRLPDGLVDDTGRVVPDLPDERPGGPNRPS